MIHIQGMGWLGSALAQRCLRAGVEFTWSDNDAEHVAWKASTGAVYPAGDDRSRRNAVLWQDWHLDGLFPIGSVAPCRYVYAHKNPPHEGRYKGISLGALSAAPDTEPCFSVDVPVIVRATRAMFESRRTDGRAPGETLIVAHGFNDRLMNVMWGWQAQVQLELPPEILAPDDRRRVMLYAREHRFHIVYAYPVPSRPGWYWAGSRLTAQQTPKRAEPGYVRGLLNGWMAAAHKLYPGVKLLAVDEPIQGWRPRPFDNDPQGLTWDAGTDTWTMPPLWHSGVRWAPELIETLVSELRARSHR